MGDECNFDSRVNRDEDKTMTDKTKEQRPTIEWYAKQIEKLHKQIAKLNNELHDLNIYKREVELNYHVIPKSDVDGDVMGALEELKDYYFRYGNSNEKIRLHINTIRNALIAQSDPDMVRIPRKVLEEVVDLLEQADNYDIDWAKGTGDNMQVMYDLVYNGLEKLNKNALNYKEGE